MKIVNIISSGSLNQKVNLLSLFSLGEIYSYNPSNYHGGYIRLNKATVTIYKTGKYILTGIKNIDEIAALWKNIVEILSKVELDTGLFTPPVIKNIVAIENLDHEINLIKMIQILNETNEIAEYEPEVFPGLILKMEGGVANIFKNGKVVLLGCKSIEDLNKLWESVNKQIIL